MHGPWSSKNNHSNRLTFYIFGALVFAIISALVYPTLSMKLHVGGEIFLRLLKMMVVPLVVASVMHGILGLGDVRKPGGAAILYYLTTTVLAVIIGLIVVNVMQPGVGAVDEQTLAEVAQEGELLTADAPSTDVWDILENLLLMLVTDNLVSSAAETNLLPLIVFAIIFAGMLTTMGERVSALTEMIGQVNEALMSFVLLLMKASPVGIFCLVAARFGKAQAEGKFGEMMSQTGMYMVTVLTGLAIHAMITLPLIYWIFTRKNPYRFMMHMAQALITAFSTASSSATLPVTMECASVKAGISKRSTEFVLPLGATINMDGTALYEAVAAIGAAGIPEAGLVTMIIVLDAVGLPVEYIGLILAVDWLLDRFRTAVNAYGDAIGAAVVEKAF